jgi:DNA repair exonuclease SbcCD nuclease subunit
MRFIHAADLHIDSPLQGLSAYEGAPVEELRGASRRALRNLVRVALDEDVDLVVLAGDVFDGDWPDYNTGLFFIKAVSDLTNAGVRVVVLAGNHDAESKLTRHLRFPVGAFRFGHEACETIRPDQLGVDVAVHGRSYATPDVSENLALSYPDPEAGVCNIGVLHTALTGRPGHDRYAPCTVEQLTSRGYDYWALGHVHQREVVAEDPWIVFPGNLQGRHVREEGPKGFTIVTVDGTRVDRVEHRDADVARWVRCSVDASGATHDYDVLDRVRVELDRHAARVGDRLLAARVVIEGTTDLHDRLHDGREAFVAAVRAQAFEAGDIWVEKVVLETRRSLDLAELRARDDAVGAVLRETQRLRGSPDELLERYGGSFDRLRAKLPPAVLARGVDPSKPEALRRALDDAEARIAALLAEGAST